jgi:hypothetical protein
MKEVEKLSTFTKAIEEAYSSLKYMTETGISMIHANAVEGKVLAYGSMVTLHKKACKELNRDFILAIVRDTTIHLYIPNKSRYHRLQSPLMILSSNNAGPVRVIRKRSEILYVFTGNEGFSAYNNFIKTCRTDPVSRVCLQI